MINTGIRQIFKTPIKFVSFLIFITVTVAFLSMGIYLFSSTQDNMKEIDAVFRTVGTIGQKPSGYIQVKGYDALSETYTYSSEPEYGKPVSLKLFDIEGVNYIHPPENRPYYHASSQEYTKGFGQLENSNSINMVEYKIEEIYPDVLPVRASVTRVISGSYKLGQEIWICQHYSENPVELTVGKSYVSMIGTNCVDLAEVSHGIAKYTALNPVGPGMLIYSDQMDVSGMFIDNSPFRELGIWTIFEVTDGFYETDAGKRIVLFAENMSAYMSYARITPTDSLELLMDFYNREVFLESGREIAQEEFNDGELVCMIGSDQARNNGLTIGDKMTLSFYDARYGDCPGIHYVSPYLYYMSSGLLNASGELYKTFYTATYEIVGIYDRHNKWNANYPFALGYGTIIIPSKSVKASDENNRNGSLILQPYNVSFEIPNGTSGEYLQKLRELGLDEQVTVTFYDRGYENIKAGLQNIQEMSLILMLAGAFTTLTVLIFFSYLFIGKEKRRTGVERSLGVPKGQCAASLLAGLMILVVLGAAAGVAIGFTSGDFVMENAERLSQENEMSTAFSNWVNEQHEEEEYVFETAGGNDFVIPVTVFSAVLLVSLSIAGAFIWSNLTKEPLRLLSEREK